MWRLPGGVPSHTFEPGGEDTLARLALGGKYIVPTSGSGSYPGATLTLYDPATGSPAAPAVTPGGLVIDADVSPDGRLLVTGSAPRGTAGANGELLAPTIRFWDVKSGQPVGAPNKVPSEPRSIRFLAGSGCGSTAAGIQVLGTRYRLL